MSIKLSPSIISLRVAVENKLGFEITCTRDCEVLAQEMVRFDRRFALSVSTLRRFYGIIKHNRPPSLSSLNAIARYVGAKSFHSWENRHINSPSHNETHLDLISTLHRSSKYIDTSPESIKKTIRSLELILNQFIKSDTFQLTRQKIIEINTLIVHLQRLNAFPESLWKTLNRNSRARIFMEAFPPLDYLNGIGRKMMEDYLQTATTREEKIFATSLLAASSLYAGKDLSVALGEIETFKSIDSNIHPMPQARILGINLLALNSGIKTESNQTNNFRSIIIKGIKHETKIWPKWSSFHGVFKLRLVEWLILSEDVELLREYIVNINKNQYSQGISFNYKWIDVSIQVYNAWALFITDNKVEALKIIDEIDLLKLYIHEERLVSIYYYALSSRLHTGEKRNSSIKTLELLTKQTEYYGLNEMLNRIR
jgi:hypothetical protein